MTLREIQHETAVWAERNFGVQPAHRPLLGALEELGELAHAHLKQEQGIRTSEDHTAKGQDAIGDIFIYLLHYCHCRGWDAQFILDTTWNEVRSRDWRINKTNGQISATTAAGESTNIGNRTSTGAAQQSQ